MIVSGLIGLSKENALKHVEEVFRNGLDINYRKVRMEDCHVVVIQKGKLIVIHSHVL